MNTIQYWKARSKKVKPVLDSSLRSGFVRLPPNSASVRQRVIGVTAIFQSVNPCSRLLSKSTLLDQGSPRFDAKKRQRKLLIRQLSQNSKHFYFDQNNVTFHRSCSLAYPTPYGNRVNLKRRSIFSLDLRHDKLLFARNHFYRLQLNRRLGYLYTSNLEKMNFLSSDIANLALSLSGYMFLKRKGINKIGDLVMYSPQALFQLLGKNRELFAELRRCSLLIALCMQKQSFCKASR